MVNKRGRFPLFLFKKYSRNINLPKEVFKLIAITFHNCAAKANTINPVNLISKKIIT
jgi:hypothetical protein